ncbi:putative bifunctional diguanylate cyclase/phosphodiesterase [Vibrio zhugei]|uniref:Bifunctional diguanylate cyclase/phosphodiesterase n=1 Tax=Vibrio zhugei TaxID=2479546 RepID=A0ABV7C6T4_9VIBR|nr:GGDEF domain-containing phosphodiesterase [Vibrio zhugei]
MYKSERLRVFSSTLPFLVFVNIAISTLIVSSGIYQGLEKSQLVWLALIYLVSTIRLSVHYFIPNSQVKKLDYHFTGVVLAGISWAIYPYLFRGSFTMFQEMITLIVFCGMSGGSATLLSSDLRSAIAFSAITVFPYSMMMIKDGGHLAYIGWMGLLYGCALCFSSRRAAAFILSSIDSQHQRDILVENLEREVKKRTEKISTLEEKDAVTGLSNRYSFISQLKLARESNSHTDELIHAFIHINLDKFHLVNNLYGYECGDHVLIEIGQRLASIDKYYDTVSGRWSNDEFNIFIQCQSKRAVEAFIYQLIEKLSVPIRYQNMRLNPTFHLGYTLCCSHTPVESAIKHSQLAMLEGKKKSIRIKRYDDTISQQSRRKHFLQKTMKTALINNDFFMQYQPITDINTKKIHGFEALVRWKLDGEFVSPQEFVGIAEEHGLIIDLGRFILKTSIKALSVINEHYPTVSMSINVSVIQLEDDNFISYLQFLVEQFGVTTRNIHLEITETAMITNLDKISDVITEAKSLGVMISVDDFGTGFSSISVLKNLSVDFIKIDKSYIDHIVTDSKDQSIVSAVTKMSHAINSQVIAEGVEYIEQLNLLVESEIDYYQGYLCSRPVEFEAMMALLAEQASAKKSDGASKPLIYSDMT